MVPRPKVSSVIKGTTSSNCLYWAMEYKTSHSLGTIHQQNGCEWLGDNMLVVTALIILYLRVSKAAENLAEGYTRGFYRNGRKLLFSLII